MPALLFSLQLGEAVWGTGLLEEPGPGQDEAEAEAKAAVQSVMLRAPHPGRSGTDGTDVAHLTPQPRGEIRGAVQLRAEWSETGAKLQLHSVKSVTISVARLYELKVAEGASEDAQSGWLLQIWGSPSLAEMTQCIPFCRMGLRCDSPVPFTSNVLYIERPVELHWPETWTPKGRGISQIGHSSKYETGTIAARCRHAMFQGSAPDSVTARSLKHWADLESWFLFGPLYTRYDDELLPIDEATALHPDGEMALVPEALQELRDDPDYIACHASVVRFILLSWGWDADSGELVKDTHAGQGWAASGQHAWRLRHLCLSCWLLGQAELRQSCNDFVLMLGSKAPWTEDGMGEAKFTLGRNGDAAIDAFWHARLPPSCSSRDERTLWGILCAADHVVDRPENT